MTDYFDPGALKRFENVNFGNENTIANLEGSGLKASGTWSRFSAIGRQDPEKAENNKARTELLKSLGNAFGLQGMSEKNGKVTFTKGFMDSLEKILGRDVFKRSDFGISGAGGEVSSGRPLTQRRINAIMTQAVRHGVIFGKHMGEFDPKVYRQKLAFIKNDIATQGRKFEASTIAKVNKTFDYVEKCLDFIENESGFLEDNDMPHLFDGCKFLMLPEKTTSNGEKYRTQVGLTGKDAVNEYIQQKTGGLYLHLEELPRFSEMKSIEPLRKYVLFMLQSYVRLSADLYTDSLQKGTLGEYYSHLNHPGLCLDDRVNQLTVMETRTASHDESISLDKCIGKEIGIIAENGDPADTWADVAAKVKEKLVGTKRPIMNAVKTAGGWQFDPVLENGKPLVRPVTAADIDRIGPACMDIINGDA